MIQMEYPLHVQKQPIHFRRKRVCTGNWFSMVIRPSFTLGGTGGGFVHGKEDLDEALNNGLTASPIHEVMVEEAVLGLERI